MQKKRRRKSHAWAPLIVLLEGETKHRRISLVILSLMLIRMTIKVRSRAAGSHI
jgi:hypothetical protein